MDSYEARLNIIDRISEILLDLAGDDEVSQQELEEMRDAMRDAAEVLLEGIGFEVVSVDAKDVITATIDLAVAG